ncbi:hypothetical protein HYPSUDRAFT_37792 [Hypholoma sublateritium FD-334 SS-4]|uniref:Uncharacterized protein n=1 Tax=Hypholoma sublateritium (strain FD-334 SS-4) TaxID=945553 RepID=A0A0D2P9M5_HYPSF|nr:hypothetical protein HYPSUDRAFT_37792 [Hypholoma sublateritium FD-334 SS-4]
MSDLPFPLEVIQVEIDALVESTILQAFVTGLYTLLFFPFFLVPLIRQKKPFFVVVLSALYIAIILNLAATWQILRSVVVTNNATRVTMILEYLEGPIVIPRMANATGSIAILLADSLLVWRCYVLWHKNKWILAMFSVFILGEFTVLPIYLTLNTTLGPHKISIIIVYFLISAGVTTLATSLIIYRIFDVSRRSSNEMNSYQYTIEILVESGVMYTATIVVTAILLAIQGSSFDDLKVVQAASYFGALLTPMTGIAPTLITARIVSGSARPDVEWSKPFSGMAFKTQDMSRLGYAGESHTEVDNIASKRIGLSIGGIGESKTVLNEEKSSV